MFQVLHEIVFHGGGGYDYDTVYNMPIWLRKFTYYQIADFKKKEQEAYDKAMSKSSSGTSIDIGSPNIPDSLKKTLMSSKRPATYNKNTSKK